MRDSIVFYRSFYEAVKELPPEDFKQTVEAIMEYGLNDAEINASGVAKAIFIMAKPQIDKNNRRYENGSKGGRKPKENQTETKKEPNDNQNATNIKPNDNVNDNVNVNKKESTEKSKRFSPPTLEQVTEYIAEKELKVDPNRFIDFYESKGWMVGKNKMKDWRAAARSWDRGQRKELTAEATRQGVTAKTKNSFNNFKQRDYDYDELEKVLLTTNPERSEQ